MMPPPITVAELFLFIMLQNNSVLLVYVGLHSEVLKILREYRDCIIPKNPLHKWLNIQFFLCKKKILPISAFNVQQYHWNKEHLKKIKTMKENVTFLGTCLSRIKVKNKNPNSVSKLIKYRFYRMNSWKKYIYIYI